MILDRPASVSAAWRQVESRLAAESVRSPPATERRPQILAPLVASIEGRANLVPDAHLAALAVDHGLVLCSTDGDFARFDVPEDQGVGVGGRVEGEGTGAGTKRVLDQFEEMEPAVFEGQFEGAQDAAPFRRSAEPSVFIGQLCDE